MTTDFDRIRASITRCASIIFPGHHQYVIRTAALLQDADASFPRRSEWKKKVEAKNRMNVHIGLHGIVRQVSFLLIKHIYFACMCVWVGRWVFVSADCVALLPVYAAIVTCINKCAFPAYPLLVIFPS